MVFAEENHVIAGIYPVADALSGTVYSDVYNLENANQITFFIMKGAGAVGTSTITIEACSNAAAAAVSAVEFGYKKCSSSTSEDTFGAWTACTSSGFATAAAANEIYVIDVPAATVYATGYQYVRLKAAEVVDAEVTATVFAVLSGLRTSGATLPEAIS